ncbi:MAG: FKBP-type peptidyl-prolyl cis-trans isomerase [Deltaproteobacteria bacterium]|nr:FKBP-type peptidyl-prolyl cis-trans isomerase [Deltaproteobacteria bacterium]
MMRFAVLMIALFLLSACAAAPAGRKGQTPGAATAASATPEATATASVAAPPGGAGSATGKAPPDVDGPPADSITTASGVSYLVLEKGKGTDKPVEESMVLIHYSGWTTDGRQFDTTRGDGPIRLRVDAFVTGLTEGLQLMVEGDRYRFWIPKSLAYGENPRPDQPQGMLVFDVELLEIH